MVVSVRRLRFGLAVVSAVVCGVAAAALPSGYTELKYLKADGNQKLLLDYTPKSTDIVEAKIKLTDRTATQAIWCSRGSSTDDRTMTLFVISKAFRPDRAKTTNVSAPKEFCLNDVVSTVRADYGQRKFFVNGGDTGVTMGDADGFTGGGSALSVFYSQTGGGSHGNFGKFYFYGLKVYDSTGALVREYVPAKEDAETSGELNCYGVYETQQGKFIASNCTGAFDYEVKNEYVLDVPAGTERTLTADDVAAAGTGDFVKAGKGTLVANEAMAGFAKDIIVREGVYRVTTTNSLGTGTGCVFVEDGASLHNTVASPSTWSSDASVYSSFGKGVKVYCEGYGFNGIGAITNSASANNLCSQVYLTGETRLGGRGDTQIRYSGLHTYGNKLHTCTPSTKFRIVAPGGNTSLADVDVESGTFALQDLSHSGILGSEQRTVSLASGTRLYLWKLQGSAKQTLDLADGSSLEADNGSFNLYTLSNTNRWDGPVSVAGTVKNRTTSPNGFTLGGKVTGDGGFWGQNSGWLRLLNGANDFTGGVTLKAGGLALHADGALPADGGPLTFAGSAQTFVSVDGDRPSGGAFPSASTLHLPDVVANGTQGSVSSIDVRLLDSSTGSVKSVSVAAGNTLTVKGALRVLGETHLDGGTLRVERSIADDGVVPGLNWWYTAYELDGYGYVSEQTPPSWARVLGTDCKGCSYAYQTWPQTSRPSGIKDNDNRYKQGFLYTGYIKVPGEEGTDVKFNVFTAIARSCKVYIDGKMVAYWNDNKAWDFEKGKEFTVGYSRTWANPSFTVKAGWRPISILMNNKYNNTRGPYTPNAEIWPSNFGIGIDWQGRCETNSAYYVKLQDPGDGSFLRATLDPTTLAAERRGLTFGGALAAAPGSLLDLGGCAASVTQLSGVPSVANGAVSVASSTWTIRKADILNADGSVVNKPLTLGTGASLSFSAGTVTIEPAAEDIAALTAFRKTRSCPIIADLSAFADTTFVLSDAFREAGWTLRAVDGGLRLEKVVGLMLLFR